jgi:hypothetical protein
VEYAIDVDKRLLVLFESGEGVLHRGGRRVLRWKLLFEAQARGQAQHQLRRQARNRRERRLSCRWQGYGKVQKHLGGSSV